MNVFIICCVPAQILYLGKILNEIFLNSKLSKSGLWTLKFTVSQELTDSLHANTNSCKLKGD